MKNDGLPYCGNFTLDWVVGVMLTNVITAGLRSRLKNGGLSFVSLKALNTALVGPVPAAPAMHGTVYMVGTSQEKARWHAVNRMLDNIDPGDASDNADIVDDWPATTVCRALYVSLMEVK